MAISSCSESCCSGKKGQGIRTIVIGHFPCPFACHLGATRHDICLSSTDQQVEEKEDRQEEEVETLIRKVLPGMPYSSSSIMPYTAYKANAHFQRTRVNQMRSDCCWWWKAVGDNTTNYLLQYSVLPGMLSAPSINNFPSHKRGVHLHLSSSHFISAPFRCSPKKCTASRNINIHLYLGRGLAPHIKHRVPPFFNKQYKLELIPLLQHKTIYNQYTCATENRTYITTTCRRITYGTYHMVLCIMYNKTA